MVAGITWDSNHKSPYTVILPGDLIIRAATAGSAGIQAVRTTVALSGKRYYEIEHIGASRSPFQEIGLCNASMPFSADFGVGRDVNSVSYYQDTGAIFWNNTQVGSASPWTTGDILALAYDSVTGRVWVAKNNVWANSGDPAAGTGFVTDASVTGLTGALYAAGGVYEGTITGVLAARFSASQFTYTPPVGFSDFES